MPPKVAPKSSGKRSRPFSEKTNESSHEVSNVNEKISTIERQMRELESKNQRGSRQYENLQKELKQAKEVQSKLVDVATTSVVSDIVGKRVDNASALVDSIAKNGAQTPLEKEIKVGIEQKVEDTNSKIEGVKNNPSFWESLEKKTLYLGILAAIGSGIFSFWNSKQDNQTAACYQMTTCQTPPVIKKVSCSKENCNCKNIAKCNLPECYLKTYGCLTYIYTDFDPKEIISTLPEIDNALDNNPVLKRYNLMKSLKKFLIVFVVVVLVGYFLLKLALKNKSLL
jgi:hypothetical protein